MTTLLRGSACVLLLMLGPSCLAQVVTVRVINAADGHPLQKQQVSVSLLYGEMQGRKCRDRRDCHHCFLGTKGTLSIFLDFIPQPEHTILQGTVH